MSGHEHDHAGHEHCGCRHDHADHDHEHCGCGHDHADHGHEHCGCGHEHHHEATPARTLAAEPSFCFRVPGVDCPNCARNVENAVRALDCVDDARLTYATATLEVVASPASNVSSCKRAVVGAVRSCGEDVELPDAERAELGASRTWYAEHREQLLMGLSGLMLVAGLVSEHLLDSEQRAIPFYVCAAVSGLVFIAPMAVSALKRRTADMNVLMGVAVVGALIMGFGGDASVFGDAAVVIFLDQVGEWLEGWSMRKTRGSVRELMDLAPAVAHVVAPDGSIVDVQTKGVEEGYTIRVLPGERVPLDGVIVRGQSSFNEAPVTGESVPKDKGAGEEVYAGTLNANAVVDLEVTADEDCTTLARIVSQVQGAQAEQAPYESFVNRFAAAYTPIVVAGAILVGVCIPLVLSLARGSWDAGLWHDWAYRACSLLVVACPCALVISTPVTFVSALSRAAKDGALVKGGAYFDIACKVSTVAFDKTGTLTTGEPQLVEVVPLAGASEEEVLAVAAALEAASTHPLARAVVAAERLRGLSLPEASDIEEVAAQGVRGIIGGVPCAVGKLDFAASDSAPEATAARDASARLGERGASALTVARSGKILGVLGIADTLRDGAPATFLDLRGVGGTRKLEMLTGDNRHAAAAVAEAAGIESVRAELLPEHKLARIGELQAAGETVAMVGDGINDAPALAKADLGVALGAGASDTALEVADVALLSSDLAGLVGFFRLAQKTMRVVRENIAFAIGVKVLVFVLVVAGVAGMGAAVFADTGVALIVVLNGMRLMRRSRLAW